jgi:sRNA-binding regulator protein Hfq
MAKPGHRPDHARREEPPAVDIDKKAADIARTTGIPLHAARLVALGQQDLNEVLKRLAFQDEVNTLIQRHNFNRALATQIALGQVSKDAMLAKRRVDEHLNQSRHRSLLEEAAADKRELQVALHGHRSLHVRVKSVDKYEVQLENLESGAVEVFHKLQLKCAWPAAESKKVRKALSWDKARKERSIDPIARPQDRFACSDKRLGLLMDKKSDITATLLEGEVFTGQIAWVSRYEFALRTRQGIEVVIFRHALDDLKE